MISSHSSIDSFGALPTWWLGGDQAPLNDSDMADEEIDTEIPDEVVENLTEPPKPPAPIPDPGPL
ncbi:hypothetical protein [Pseudomonas rhizoryzae]|uniref:hypothetical protein n=1 Tax=Pseudomonas rhizoryzae TaxID=2571129 RepID=UPI0007373016|nr:hypothetical protein [Pseudomonas rhizoryzae]APQ10456.1 hypothetical protein BJP27_02640 [Pseudomonas psychrotolerans]KTT07912.1 hypothetical protein NS2R_21835 [Pseudomonas psychrotolerans]KTT24592.1 hypothetical protein SB14R_09785 [Pseudomonas psychrotolerans]KTT30828.1 hypothetical protein NS201_12160 [Pseudomonas psychrotolerans]KTT37585.1 hypothetical protein SB9_01390 [Pseudomonas psychrotolerans]